MAKRPVALHGTVDALLTRYPDLAAKEVENEAAWWWLSFSGGGSFSGVVIVHARGFLESVNICYDRHICPGTEVLGEAIPPELLPAARYRNIVLTESQARKCMPGADVTKIEVARDHTTEAEL